MDEIKTCKKCEHLDISSCLNNCGVGCKNNARCRSRVEYETSCENPACGRFKKTAFETERCLRCDKVLTPDDDLEDKLCEDCSIDILRGFFGRYT